MMVKRQIPRPPGRRRSPPTPPVVSAPYTAMNEVVVGPADEPATSIVALGSHDTATSAQALLSSDVALEGAIDMTAIDDGPPASATSAVADEPAVIEPPLPEQVIAIEASPILAAAELPSHEQDVDVVESPALAAFEPPPQVQDVDVVVSPALAALQPPPFLDDVPIVLAAQPHKAAPFVPTDLAAAGATLQAFILNEGLAAFAHWRALTHAPSPAEALRLHVGEMQRAADASITCMGRIVGHLGRIGATKAA